MRPTGRKTLTDAPRNLPTRRRPWFLLRRGYFRDKPVLRTILAALAVILILKGLIFGLLPIVPGWPLIIPGLLLLIATSRRARYFLAVLKERLPERWQRRVAFLRLRRRRRAAEVPR